MADLSKRLSGPARPGAAAATAYTTPALTRTIVKQIIVNNPSAASVDYTLSVGADAAATRVINGVPIGADEVVVFDVWIPLAAAEILQHFASSADVLQVTISGVEIT